MANRTSKKPEKAVWKRSSNAAGTPHIIHHKDGSIWAKGSMLGGKMHGYWEFFRKDGSMMRSGSFDREQQVGAWTTYDTNGKAFKVTAMKKPGKSNSVERAAGSDDPIAAYDSAQASAETAVCRKLRAEIERALPEATAKVWHGSPVWFVGETPVVGYNVPAKGGVVLLFWNGQAFGDPALKPIGKFKAAQARFANADEIKVAPLRRWLKKAGTELWDVSSIRSLRAAAKKRK
jgi:hypothetical protein